MDHDWVCLAITDHGNCNHFGDLYLQCHEYGVKGIYGNEFYFIPDLDDMWKTKEEADTNDELSNQERKDLRNSIRRSYHLTLIEECNWIEKFIYSHLSFL